MVVLVSNVGAAIFLFCCERKNLYPIENLYTELCDSDLFIRQALLHDSLPKQDREHTLQGRLVCREGVCVLLLCLCTGILVLSRLPDGSFLASHQSVQQLERGNYLRFPCLSTTSENTACHYPKWLERRIIQPECHSKVPGDELKARVVCCLAMPFCKAWVRWMLCHF